MSCDQHWKNSVWANMLVNTVHVKVFGCAVCIPVRVCEETQAGQHANLKGFFKDWGARTPEGETGWRRG